MMDSAGFKMLSKDIIKNRKMFYKLLIILAEKKIITTNEMTQIMEVDDEDEE